MSKWYEKDYGEGEQEEYYKTNYLKRKGIKYNPKQKTRPNENMITNKDEIDYNHITEEDRQKYAKKSTGTWIKEKVKGAFIKPEDERIREQKFKEAKKQAKLKAYRAAAVKQAAKEGATEAVVKKKGFLAGVLDTAAHNLTYQPPQNKRAARKNNYAAEREYSNYAPADWSFATGIPSGLNTKRKKKRYTPNAFDFI